METIKIERVYNAPIEVVWKAISDREQMTQWYFDIPEFKPEQDAWFEWHGGEPGGKQWLHRGRILECITNKKLVHSWEYPGYQGVSTITWELSTLDKNKTKLNFSHEFTVPFDPNEKAFDRSNFAAGWDHIVNKGLTAFVEK